MGKSVSRRKAKLGPRLKPETVDRVWSNRVRSRDEYRCQLCGSRENPQAHHILKKKSHKLRYSLDNGITLCAGCHHFLAHSVDNEEMVDTSLKIRQVIGRDRWESITALKHDQSIKKVSLEEYLERLQD